jgi:hypothetical protein
MARISALVVGFFLLLAGPALATCASVGSQLDCRWPGIAMRIGTQIDPTASQAGSVLRMQGFAGPVIMGREAPARDTLAISLQSFSDDRRACNRFGNETYCH